MVFREKGYGFITPDEGGTDVFVHHTAIMMEGFRSLTEGEKVEYEITQGLEASEEVAARLRFSEAQRRLRWWLDDERLRRHAHR